MFQKQQTPIRTYALIDIRSKKLGALIKLEQARFANRCLTFEHFKEEITKAESLHISFIAFVFGPSLSHVCPIIFYYLQLSLNFFSLLAVYPKE